MHVEAHALQSNAMETNKSLNLASRHMNERNRQQLMAYAHDGGVYRHHFIVSVEFGGTFSAIAATREGALCVMDAEVRGASLTARYDGATTVPCYRERAREEARLALSQLKAK